jgi:hypothetical protein
MRRRVAVVTCLAFLALPAQALAHGRNATVALDYRLVLSPATVSLPGVHVRVLDGDRDFQVRVDPGTDLLVRGALHEPMLRIDRDGVWVNADSPTATGDKIIPTGKKGWVRVSRGASIAWHDHRLAPPPVSRLGPVGRFVIPVDLNGRPETFGGTFFRVARPPLWPWLAGAAVFVAGILLGMRHRSLRTGLTIVLGLCGGLAALATVTTFAARDAPTGGTAWLQIGTGILVAVVLSTLVVRLRGRARVHAAGVVGAVAAAVSLSSLPVFRHGVVISAVSPSTARALCGLALVAGVGAAGLSFLPDFDEPVRVARR